jgi:penicillin G amidase
MLKGLWWLLRVGLRSVLWLALLALILGCITAWLYARQATPRTQGDLLMPNVPAAPGGSVSELRIDRDSHGIPTIRAASLKEAMYGLGVVHAQDRLWQLETHRRIGSGRMAEAFGEAALENDKFLRALGVKRAAEKQWAQTKGEAREVLEAYTAGINDVIQHQTKARPPEMLILRLPLEPWTPADSMAWATMMAWDLGNNWGGELMRMRLALKLPLARVNEVMPPYADDKPLATADYAALYQSLKLGAVQVTQGLGDVIDRTLAAAPPSGVEGTGSNNWVLAGSHTTTGKPLLANDPHLKLTTPALWYFARIEVPGMKVAGATMPGLPSVVLGQNEHLAWGFTNTGPDVQDLYLERLDYGNAQRYDAPNGPQAFQVVQEIIKVKDKPDVAFAARSTRHGPVISDAGTVPDVLGGSKDAPRFAISMRWTALDDDVDPIGVALAMMRATSVKDFVAATRTWVAPMQNMVVADKLGSIAMVAPGRIPLRGPDHDLKGFVPAPGWEAKYDWVGTLDVDQTPREFDPERGWIATANQRVVPADYPHFLTSEWAIPFRQQRIEQLLKAKPRHSLDDLRNIQADVQSLGVNTLLPWLKKAQSTHPLATAAMAQLKDFDGAMSPGAVAPSIYWVWLRHLTQQILADELGAEYFERSLATRQYRDAVSGVMARDDAWWCDDKTTAAAETCAAQADTALSRALDELDARFGKDVKAWHWGALHQARSEHRPFSRVKPLAKLFELRTPMGGDTFTVNVSRVGFKADPTTGERYLNEHAASLRALYDVGDLSQSRFMHSTGQSGIPWSAHYRDFVDPWARVEYVPVWAPDGPAAATLTVKRGG